MNVENTPFNVKSTGPTNPDQIQACWRYLLNGEEKLYTFDQMQQQGLYQGIDKPLTLLHITAIAVDTFNTLAAQIHADNTDNLQSFSNKIDYSTWHQNYPGYKFESTGQYMSFRIQYPEVFHSQLNWECTRWNLNVNIMKGCLLGWAIEKRNLRDAIAQTKMKDFMKYHGPPHLLSKVPTHVVSEVAMITKVGKAGKFKKGRGKGGHRKGRGRRGKGRRSKRKY